MRRDFGKWEERRLETARLLGEGCSQSEVACELGVHRQSVSRWARQLEQGGVRGLGEAERIRRLPKLTQGQLRDVASTLKRRPEALGYASGLWTARRGRNLIEQQSGVRYHEDHVGCILRELGWSRCRRRQTQAQRCHY